MIAVSLAAPRAAPVLAGQPESLDKEFLDYLAACEGKDDNWTVIADDKRRAKAAEKNSPKASPDKAAPKPGAKP
jgi:hypothetical protein